MTEPIIYHTKLIKPSQFLSRISQSSPQPLTTTEEIYESEQRHFCEDLLPPKRLSDLPKLTSFASRTPRHLPPVSKCLVKRSVYSLTPSNKTKESKSFSKIIQVYEDGLRKNVNSKSLNEMVMKANKIAKEYTKEMEWTSKQLLEIEGLGDDFMKKIFDEMKSSRKIYESEAKKAVDEFSHKLVLGKGYRLKVARRSRLII